MFVTIKSIGFGSWSVFGEGRSMSGFSSEKWAQHWCDEMGYIVWDDPDQ
jgi:hypothetical protein